MVLRSKHIWGFNTFFRPHQRKLALERGVVDALVRSLPSATLQVLMKFHMGADETGTVPGEC